MLMALCPLGDFLFSFLSDFDDAVVVPSWDNYL
jgi:hypothetical protein